VVQRLREATELGDIMALRELGAELEARADGGGRCGSRIRRLAAAFDLEGILALVSEIEAQTQV